MFFQLFGVPGIDVLATDAQIATHEALHRIWVGMLSNLDCRVLAFWRAWDLWALRSLSLYMHVRLKDLLRRTAFVSVFKL